jgi:hypothetical protein
MSSANVERKFSGPPYTQIIQWVLDCWDEIDVNIIKESYAHCGINPNEYVDAEYNRLYLYHYKLNK